MEEVVLGVAPTAETVPGWVRADESRHAAPHDAKYRERTAEADRSRVPPDPWQKNFQGVVPVGLKL